MKITKRRFIFYLVLWISLVTFHGPVYAAEGIGGQVSTSGKITFYDITSDGEETPEDSSPPDSPVPDQPPSKPVGNLPSTGELGSYLGFMGIGLIFLVMLFLFIKKKIEEDK